MRPKKDSSDDHTRKNEDLKGRGGRLKHYNVDGDVPLCLRKTEGKSKDGSSNKKNNDDKSKMVSGSKDLCCDSTRKRNDKKINKEVTFIALQKI